MDMSTKTTPRDGAQSTARSRTKSLIPPHSEPKTKASRAGSMERNVTASSTEIMSSRVDLTARSEPETEVPVKQDMTDLPFFKQDQFTDVILQVGDMFKIVI
jgi:hypothetical protein